MAFTSWEITSRNPSGLSLILHRHFILALHLPLQHFSLALHHREHLVLPFPGPWLTAPSDPRASTLSPRHSGPPTPRRCQRNSHPVPVFLRGKISKIQDLFSRHAVLQHTRNVFTSQHWTGCRPGQDSVHNAGV